MKHYSYLDYSDQEDSIWPAFSDIMMTIVMIFLMVVVTVVIGNHQLTEELKGTLQAKEKAVQERLRAVLDSKEKIQEIQALNQKIVALEKQSTQYQNELIESIALAGQRALSLANKQQRIDALEVSLEEKGKALNARISDLEEESTQQQKIIVDLRNESSAAIDQLSTLKIQLNDESAALKREQALRQALSKKMDQTQAELTRNQKLLSDENTLKLTQEQKIDALNRLLAEWKSKHDALELTASQREQTIDELRRQQHELQSNQTRNQRQSKEETERLKREISSLVDRSVALQSEYDILDGKYQKLLRPSRSSKGKTVASVIYTQEGFQLKNPNDSDYKRVDRVQLNKALSQLKEKFQKDLYVKVIIPENSGLSYNDAWTVTHQLLKKYDYYYQNE